jgi:hypothetical protein
MSEIRQVALVQDRRGWRVELHLHTGCVRRYSYRSEAQARFFAAVFALGPRVLPPAPAAAPGRRRRSSLRAEPRAARS